VLGFKLVWRVKPEDSKWDEIVFVELGGSQIEIKSAKNPAPFDTSVRVGLPRLCLLADDLKETLHFLETKGVETTGPLRKVSGPNGTRLKLAEIKDLDGISIELIERID
jgi:catechol 2,3-dioxygenase-like lactoylglutathione lyase family enzyme